MRYFFNKDIEMLVSYDPSCDTVTELTEIGSGVDLGKKIMKDAGGGADFKEKGPAKKSRKAGR